MPEFPSDVLEFLERGDPGASANVGKVYTKDVAGVTQLFYQASDGAVAQATPVLPNPGSITYANRTFLLTTGPGNSIPIGVTTAVPIFSPPGDEATLAANSEYQWVLHVILTNTPQSCSARLSFGGTATYSIFNSVQTLSWGSTGSLEHGVSNSTAPIAINTNTRSSTFVIVAEGTFRTSAGGTIIPLMDVTAAQSTPMVARAGSYMELIYLGPDTFVSQGGWG